MSRSLDLAERALGFLEGEGQVTVAHERSLLLGYARSAPTQAIDIDDTSIHLLALRDGHLGAATTNEATDEALRGAARARGRGRRGRRARRRPCRRPPRPSCAARRLSRP